MINSSVGPGQPVQEENPLGYFFAFMIRFMIVVLAMYFLWGELSTGGVTGMAAMAIVFASLAAHYLRVHITTKGKR